MIRRVVVIAIVFALALLFMYLKNGVLTGERDFFVTMEPIPGEQRTFELVLADLTGTRDSATDAELAEVRRRLEFNIYGEPEPIPHDEDSVRIVGAEGGLRVIRLELGGEIPVGSPDWNEVLENAKRRLTGNPYHRDNPPRPLWYVDLGIDLRGGVEFTCALIDKEGIRVPADDETVTILKKRLDVRGLTEPEVRRFSNGDVGVTIPGGTEADADRTRKVLETAGQLEIREVLEVFGRGPGREGANPKHYHSDAEPGGYVQSLGENRYRLDPTKDAYIDTWNGEVLYPAKPKIRGEPPTVFYRLGPKIIGGDEVEGASIGNDESGGIAVNITFTPPGGVKNLEFTTEVKRKGDEGRGTGRIAVCLDGVVPSAPTVITPSGRRTQISGSFDQEEAKSLRTVFKAGSLEVTPEVQSQRVVGASLGHETVQKGFWSMIVALILVLGLIVAYYRKLGAVAMLSLICCVALIYAVLVVFGATLTLPGIAGLVLTVGMAVDANILIFERLREELARDVDLATGIDKGYGRAFVTILDANLTTFIAALILYILGEGTPVKGFGLTLMIGIATSMFAAIFVGRLLTEWLYRRAEHARVPALIGLVRLPYVRWRYGAFVVSALLIVAGAVGFFSVKNLNQHFNIDFTGGHAVQVTFNEPLEMASVKDAIADLEVPEDSPVDPADIQYQAYYPDFGAAGGASPQWVFKTRDVPGIEIERELRRFEEDLFELQRELRIERARKKSDQARIAALEDRAEAAREPVEEKRAELRQRTEKVKRALTEAFPGLIDEEGSEILGADWEDETLTLEVETVHVPTDEMLGNLRRTFEERGDVVAADLAARNEPPGVRTRLTFNAAPRPLDEYEVVDPSQRRIATMLAADGVPPAQLNGQVDLAFESYKDLVDAAGGLGLQVAKPFPSTEHFSGTVADQMKRQALIALGIALLAILAYVAARFEFSFGIGSVIALIHDVLITVGLLALFGVPIDLTVVAALLAIIGYSLNDTIVVFDRIREHRQLHYTSLAETIDIAIAQTMSRTILTSSTTMAVVLILFFFGGEGVYAFSAALLIGLVLGTYSSIFVAAPVLLALNRNKPRPQPEEVEGEGAGEGALPSPA